MLDLGGFIEIRQGGKKVNQSPTYGFNAVFGKVAHPPYYAPETMPSHDGGRFKLKITSFNTKYPQPELFLRSPKVNNLNFY